MAKFQDKHLKLRYNQRAYFGDNDDCSIWHDGAGMRISCTISGVDPQEDYHLTTKQYVDGQTFLDLPDTPATYSGSADYLVTVKQGEDGVEFTPLGNIPGVVTITGTQTITGDKTFDNTLTTFLGDVFFDGITITMSGTTLNTESNPVFNFDSTSEINFGGDVNYLDGSTTVHESGSTEIYEGGSVVTFSGTTTFNSSTTFNGPTSGICHSDLDCLDNDDHTIYVPVDGSRGFTATVSGITPTQDNDLATKWYVDQVTGMHKETGREALALNDSSKAVTFSTAFGDTNYSVSTMLNNTTDASPSIYPMIITNRTSTGFTVLFSGDIDSNNYELEWIAVDDD